jgi:predicted negative regulator of RcsB-dependent stress response
MPYTATDKEQIEEIKKWWNDYGKAIAIAVIIGLVIGFGWRYWSRYRTAEEDTASAMYQAMLQATSKEQAGPAFAYAEQIQQKYGSTVYASMASLMAGRIAVITKKYSEASTMLSWVIQNGKIPAYKQIARIRDARVLLQLKEPQLAMKVLATVDDNNFAPLISNVKGEIYLAENNSKAANAAFEKAKSGYQAAGLQNPFLELRLSS